jgi:hypothetical protein
MSPSATVTGTTGSTDVIRPSERPGTRPSCDPKERSPYLAPELQLLFKSKNFRTKDELDAIEAIPELTEARRLRLHELLPEDHPWQELLAD